MNLNQFTKLPNDFIDESLKELSPSATKIMLVLFRKIIGFHKIKDHISYSQFADLTGLTINTIKKSIRELIKKGYIRRVQLRNSYEYQIVHMSHCESHNFQNESKIDHSSWQKMTHPISQFLPPQKEKIKKKLKNTTSSDFDVNLNKIIEYWNDHFSNKMDINTEHDVAMIKAALNDFTTEEIQQAIRNRSKSEYYKNKKPLLRDKPGSFFYYPETIKNDMRRQDTPKLFTYEQRNELIVNQGYRDEDFKIRKMVMDKNGRPKWELLNF